MHFIKESHGIDKLIKREYQKIKEDATRIPILNNKKRTNEAIRQRVEAALKSEGYFPLAKTELSSCHSDCFT